ncbi:hypothetical protein TNCV_2440651 [Trichonephila clavipes]|nr:hypothetical protein TNCV_2440651 [Trichonephila clavipes]
MEIVILNHVQVTRTTSKLLSLSPNYPTNGRVVEVSAHETCVVPLHGGSSAVLVSVAIGVSSRPKLTGIVRGKAFLHVLRRRPIGFPDSRKCAL